MQLYTTQPKALEQSKAMEFNKLRKLVFFSWNNKHHIIYERVNELMGVGKKSFLRPINEKQPSSNIFVYKIS